MTRIAIVAATEWMFFLAAATCCLLFPNAFWFWMTGLTLGMFISDFTRLFEDQQP